MYGVTYKQCDLIKGDVVDRGGWVESKFAVEGKMVRLKQGDVWTDGWIVLKVYDGEISESEALKLKDLYKNHRKGTDI